MSKPSILALCGSPRKANSRTAQLAHQLLAGAESAGAQVDFVDVTALNVKYCVGCDRCHVTGDCSRVDDDFAAVWEKILAADGVVLASPVYIFQVTAQLKVLLDRMGQAFHCQMFSGKYGAAITTAGSAGHEETAAYIEMMIQFMGGQTVGHVACAPSHGMLAPDAPEMLEAKTLGFTLAEAIRNQTEYSEQVEGNLARRQMWGGFMGAMKDVWKWEYAYWQEKGWL